MSEAVTSGKVAVSVRKTHTYEGKNRVCQNPSRLTSRDTLILARLVTHILTL
jgi:hypothetical protein